jgi:hypothetical protein
MTPIDGTLPLASAEGGVSHRIGRLNVMRWRGWKWPWVWMATGVTGTDDDAANGLCALDAHLEAPAEIREPIRLSVIRFN